MSAYATRLIDESTHPDTALTVQQIIAAAVATAHTHALADITDAGALAALDTVDAAQIDAAAVTAAKLDTSNAAGAPTDGYVLSWDDTAGSLVWVAQSGGGGSSAWGGITGTLSDQTDLQTALDGKSDTGHTHTLSDVTDAGTLAGLNAVEAAQITTSNAAGAPTDGYVLSYDHTAGSMVWISAGSPGAHTHTLSDITDAGTLAGLNSVDSAQIAADAITPAKLETYNAKDGATDGYVVSYDHTLGAFVLVEQSGQGGSYAWGDLTGTLSDQTDLQTALDGKAATSHTHTLANITDSGALAALDFVSTGDIATGAVDTNQIAAGAVNSTKLDTTNEANYGADGYVLSWNDTAGQMTWVAQSGGSPSWGSITGTLSNQTDLQTALDAKAASTHTHTLSDITDAGTLAGLNSVDTAQIAADAITPAKLETYNEVDATTDGFALTWDNTLGAMVWASVGGGGSPSWGSITGTLSDQTDLQSALDAKAFTNHSHNHTDIIGLGSLATLNSVDTGQIVADAVTPAKLDTTNAAAVGTDGYVLSYDHSTSRMTWIAQAGGSPSWGSITGSLSNQTDLQSALNAKANNSHTHLLADITNAGSMAGYDHVPASVLLTSNDADATTDGYVLSWDDSANHMVWVEKPDASHTHTLSDITDAGTLAYLSLIDSAQLATGAVTPDKFATWNAKDATTDGFVLSWNNSNSSFELVEQSSNSHTHTLADITDAGTLAGLNSVDSAQIAADAITPAKLETYNAKDGTTDGYVVSYDNTLGAFVMVAQPAAGVPYSGATGDVDLGSHGLTAADIVIQPGTVSTVGVEVELQPSHTGNAIEVNTSGGSGGDVFKVTAAGQVHAGYSGTDTNPGLKVGDFATGITANGNVSMKLLVNGNVRGEIGATGFRSGADGVVSSPSYGFTNHSTTGTYIDSTSANNPMAITHGGHRIARFNQYRGTKFEQRPTGTSHPAVEIIVQGSGTGAALAITDTTTGDMVSIEQNGDALFDDRLQIDDNATAGQTRLLLWDVDSGSLRRVGVYNDGTRDLLYLV